MGAYSAHFEPFPGDPLPSFPSLGKKAAPQGGTAGGAGGKPPFCPGKAVPPSLPPLACGHFPLTGGIGPARGEAQRESRGRSPYQEEKKRGKKKERQRAPTLCRGPLPVCVVVKEREKWEICMITGYDDILTDN